MKENNKLQNLQLKFEVVNGDFENGSGKQNKTGWIGTDKFSVYQLLDGEVYCETSFDNTFKYSGFNSLKTHISSFANEQSNLYIRFNIRLITSTPWNEIKDDINTIKIKLSFWSNAEFKGISKNHTGYLTTSETQDINVPRLGEFEIETNTNGLWKNISNEIILLPDQIEENMFLYICIGNADSHFAGDTYFDEFSIKTLKVEVLNDTIPESNTNEQLHFAEKSFEPIPSHLVTCFESYLNSCSITDYEISGLRNDPYYPFAALQELWHREGLDYEEFIIYVHEHFPVLEREVQDYLEYQDIHVSFSDSKQKETTLRQIMEKDYGQNTSSLIIFYIKVLLSSFSDDPDTLLDEPVSESLSSLLSVVQAFKEKTNNIDQLRTLDLIETSLDKYTHTLAESFSNVLTPEERLEALPSLSETNKVLAESENSAADAIMQLIDSGSQNIIPKYEFRLGGYPLPNRSQQKMNYLMNIIHGINEDKNITDYSKWMPGFFGTGGGVANNILSEATRRNILESFFHKSIDDGLNKYSTLDANPALKDFISSSLAQDLADRSYGVKGVFKNFGEIAGGLLASFESDTRDKDNFEQFFVNNVKKKTDEALKEGFTDKDGNFHPAVPMSEDVRDFVSSSASSAGLEGFNENITGLQNIPTSLTDTVGINPLGDFYKNSLGSVFFPDTDKGLMNVPLDFSPSVPNRIGDKLQEYLPPSAISGLKNDVFNNPEIYRNSRFDGSFADSPDFQNVMKNSGISDFRLPQIKDGINSGFALSNLDRNNDYISKLASISNEGIGNIDKRLGIPFNDNYSPLANMVPLVTAPLIAGTNFLGKTSNIPYIPGNQQFFDNVYGPRALASKGIDLPTNYSPNVMNKLMEYEAPFKNPISIKPSQQYSRENFPQFNSQQLRQIQDYNQAISKGNNANIPNFIPQYIQQNQKSFSPEQILAYQQYQKALQESRINSNGNVQPVYPPEFIQQMINQPQQQIYPTNNNRPTREQLEQYQKYQEAMKSGSYGQNRPKPSRSRNAYKGAQENQRKAQEGANKGTASGAVAGFTIGTAFGLPSLVLPLAPVFGLFTTKIIGTILGTEKSKYGSKFKNFVDGVADFASLTAAAPSTLFNFDPAGNPQISLQESDNLWNNTLGKIGIFGKNYELGGIFGNGSPTHLSPYLGIGSTDFEKKLHKMSGMNLMTYNYFRAAENELNPTKKLWYENAAQNALSVKRQYAKFFKLIFSDDAYIESLGLDPTVTGLKSSAYAFINYNPYLKAFELTDKYDQYVDRDPTKGLSQKIPSQKFGKKFLNSTFSIRRNAGGVWKGFLGLASPLRGNASGFAGAFDYFTSTIPNSVKLISTSFYGLLPKEVKKYFLIFLGGADEEFQYLSVGKMFHAGTASTPGTQRYLEIQRKVTYRDSSGNVHFVITGYRSKLLKTFWQSNFGKYLTASLKKKNNSLRTGFTKFIFGKYKRGGYDSLALKHVFARSLIHLPSILQGRVSGFLHFFTNPSQILQSKLKQLFISLIKNILKATAEFAFTQVKKILIKLFEKLSINIATGFTAALSVGCLILGVFIILAIISIGAIGGATKTAYGGAFAGTVPIVVGGGCVGGQAQIQTIKDSEGNSVTAKFLNVPYFNQKLLDPAGATDPEKTIDKVYGNPAVIKAGGNMCGAATSTMAAGYYSSLPISSSSQVLQDYMYMDKSQQNTFNIEDIPGACPSSTELVGDGSVQHNVKGAFYTTSDHACQLSSIAGITKYLTKLGISPSSTISRPNFDVVYKNAKESIDSLNPMIMSIQDGDFGHINLIIGYTYDSTGAVTGVVVNDPYSNIQINAEKKGGVASGAYDNNGKMAVYNLEKPFASGHQLSLLYIMRMTGKTSGSGVCTTTTPPATGSDHIIQGIWTHRQNHELSCEFASLATSIKTVGVDLNVNATNNKDAVSKIEDKIISDSGSLIDKSIPSFNANGNIQSWGNPDKTFVGSLDKVGVIINPKQAKNTNDPNLTIGGTINGGNNTCIQSGCGYGTYAPVIDKIAKLYSNQGINSELLSRDANNQKVNLQKLYDAVDKNNPSIVWTLTQFATMSDSELNSYIKEKTDGKFKWTDQSNSANLIDYIPHEHAVVFAGYSKQKVGIDGNTGVVYLMDPYKNGSSIEDGIKDDSQNLDAGKIEISENKFIKLWSLFDYQAVIISKK